MLALAFLLSTMPGQLIGIQGLETRASMPVPTRSLSSFVENAGQLPNKEIAYYSEGPGLAVGFLRGALLLRITGESRDPPTGSERPWTAMAARGVVVRIGFEGANAVPPEGSRELPYRTNYLLGNDPSRWWTGVRSFREVVYRALYDGVDLVFQASGQGLKYKFLVDIGSDPAQIRFAYEGILGLSVDGNGELEVSTVLGELRDAAPVAGRGDLRVRCSYVLLGPTTVGLQCPRSEGLRPLVIDPLVYSTFLGGTGSDQAWSVAVDDQGSAYVTGQTRSSDFPTTPGAFDPSAHGGYDVFVTKFNATGTGLVYSTYIGGTGPDEGYGIAVDDAGSAFVTGRTRSPDFPTTPGAFDRTCGTDGNCDRVGATSYSDVFVTQLTPQGDALVYSTFLGGRQSEGAWSVALDVAGAAYVTGYTNSTDFPTSPGAFDGTCGTDGNCDFDGTSYVGDAFLTKVGPVGDALAFSTFIGGARPDTGYSVKVDSTGNVYLTGDTQSDDFPTTPGALQTIRGVDAVGDAFVTKMNPSGSALVYSTFLGGNSDDTGEGLALGTSGEVFLVGETMSGDFPTTPGAFDRVQNTPGVMYDLYVAKLNATGSGLIFSTFLGGSRVDGGTQGNLGVSAAGEVYVTGFTNSSDFPTTPGAYDPSWNGDYDAFVTKLDSTGGSLVFSTYLGGWGTDWGRSLAIDATGDAYVVGMTTSFDFPFTPGAFRTGPVGGGDAFVLKLAPLPDLVPSDIAAVPAPPLPVDVPAAITANVTNAGDVGSPPSTVLAFGDANGNGIPDPGELIGSQAVPALPPSGRSSVSIPWTPRVEGTHRVCLLADAANDVREWNETNNLLCMDVLAVAPPRVKPDYTPRDPQPASPVTVGLLRDVSLSLTVANAGNGSANRTAALAFFNASTPSLPFATFAVPPIPAGEVSSLFVATWRSPAVAGTSEIVADVDHGDDLAEWNESNNAYAWTIDVVPGPVTDLVLGQPNATVGVPYVTFATPLSLSISDPGGSGIRVTRYGVDGAWTDYLGPFSLAGEGEHFVEWSSEDNAGNVEATRNATLRVDDTPPTTTLAVGDPKHVAADTFVTSSSPLTLAAADGGALPVGLAATEYRIDGAPLWTPYAAPFVLAGEGTHTLEYRSRDLLGNEEGPHAATLVVDDSPPTVSVVVGTPRHDGAETYVTNATRFTITAIDGGVVPVGVASVEYRLGGAWMPYATSFALTGPDGPMDVEYRATDLLGHVAADQTAVVLDDTPPTTTPSHGDGAYPLGTTFAFPANDAGSGLARTEVRVDDGNWTVYATPLELPEGAHTIGYRSIDNLDNTEAERTLSVTISGPTPPTGETNWKPLVAAVFATILAIVGAWSSRRAPWPTGTRRRLRAFLLTALPFVATEVGTGVVSFFTGLLAIPSPVPVGIAVDSGILVAGIVVAVYRALRRTPST